MRASGIASKSVRIRTRISTAYRLCNRCSCIHPIMLQMICFACVVAQHSVSARYKVQDPSQDRLRGLRLEDIARDH